MNASSTSDNARQQGATPSPFCQTGTPKLVAQIVSGVRASAATIRVAEVRIGLGYTAVMLEDKRLGVAYTFREQAQGGCEVFKGIRPLASRSALDLIVLLESGDPIEAAVGLACVNALVNQDRDGFVDGDVLSLLELKPEDHVGMVGNFGPLVSIIQKRAHCLTVFERIEKPCGMLRPEKEALDVLPRCQVALITATTLINHTADELIASASDCREVVLLGASTPLLPEAFRGRKVTMLSGVIVAESREVLRVVSEGGGMRQFSPNVRKVSIRINGQ